MKKTNDISGSTINGFAMFVVVILMALTGLLFLKVLPLIGGLLIAVAVFLAGGFCIIQPNEAKVLTFLGTYTGTLKDQGFWWVNPLSSKQRISLRVRNFHSDKLKVNDAAGNPIEIASVVVWKVDSAASALFDVDNYEEFVRIQSETAMRSLANHYPYDIEAPKVSLRGAPEEVARTLKTELEDRLQDAGVMVIEARLSHLAYSPEIAQAMLRKQQAQAVIAARQQIVEGAVGMVKMALKQLAEEDIVNLDEERKAAMVNNLMVALVSETEAQPIINAGSIY